MSNAGFVLTPEPVEAPAPPVFEDVRDAQFHRRGILFVVSAPSGGGKSTLLNALRPGADFEYSISCTTRPARPGELHGQDYWFISREEFEQRATSGLFLELATVHGNFYGTPLEPVLEKIERGTDVLVDIDIQGAAQIRRNARIADSIADIFLMPPSLAELRRRLTKRGTETPEQIEMRLRNADAEISAWRDYRYALVSGAVDDDVRNFRAIMRAERQRTSRLSFPEWTRLAP